MYFAMLAAMLVTGCKKEDDPPAPTPTPTPTAHAVRIEAMCSGTYYLHVSTHQQVFDGWVNGDTTITTTAVAGNTIGAQLSNNTGASTLKIFVDNAQVATHGAGAGVFNPVEYVMP